MSSINDTYLRHVEDFFNSNIFTMKLKREDYASDGDPFDNFRFAADCAGITVEKVFLVLLGVKLARLRTLLLHGKEPNNESISDTLGDTSNYVAILDAYLALKNSTDPDYVWADQTEFIKNSQWTPGDLEDSDRDVEDRDTGDEQSDPPPTPAARLREFFFPKVA